MSRRVRAALVALTTALALVAAGCSGLPESGPVHDSDVLSPLDGRSVSDINAVPPVAGASRIEIARGFLDAMTASPVRVDIVREYLTDAAAADWEPEAATITYGEATPRDDGSDVVLSLSDAERLGPAGEWEGPLSPAAEQMRLPIAFEDGEYRITDPPDALVVPASWYSQRFEQVSLYYFDPTGRILVPQPVFVPRGGQRATALLDGLLAGPDNDLRTVVRSYLPRGLSLSISVPVSADGLADIELVGDVGVVNPSVTDKVVAQLAWTLRQDPAIRVLRVRIGDTVLTTPDGRSEFAVDEAATYDPVGLTSSPDLFGLRDGLLSVRVGNELDAVSGPFGTGGIPLRSATVGLDATEVAAVGSGGRRLLRAPLDLQGEPVSTVFEGTDLLPPAWDFADRIWVVDRTLAGARVHYVDQDRVRSMQVDGVTGEDVVAFLVSRDGTRFVAVVREPTRDVVRAGRMQVSPDGQLVARIDTDELAVDPALQARVRDIAWTSPVTIALLTAPRPEVFEVRSLSVDGSPAVADELVAAVTGDITALVGSPDSELPVYALSSTGLVDLQTGAAEAFVDGPPRTATYVGG